MLQRESGCKHLPFLERLSADVRVLAPVGAVSPGGGLVLLVLTPAALGRRSVGEA